MTEVRLDLRSAPFDHATLSTRRLMWETFAAAVVVALAAAWAFGVVALLLTGAAVSGAMTAEAVFSGRGGGPRVLRDGSAALTGLLMGLTLPPSVPLWMAFLGGAVSIALGKAIWGGLGRNLFNPALVGRAFLQAAFPEPLTTWMQPGQGFWSVPKSTLALPFAKAPVDVVTTATPLGLAKFEGQGTALGPLFDATAAGSLGETARIVLVVCGLWLAFRRVFDWRLPASTLLTVAAIAGAMQLIAPGKFPGAAFMLGSGGLLFAAVFMVTDPVTTPITPRGAWIFGIGTGVLVVLIRIWGGLPEGVMYAILLMNAFTPLLNRLSQPRRFGG